MKKRYIFIGIIILIIIIFSLFNDKEDVIEAKSEVINKSEIKEEFKYNTNNYDNINELVKETVVEEIKTTYVVEKIKNGLIVEDGKVYYYENNVKAINRFINNMYFNENGEMVLGFYDIEGNTYYFNEEGYVTGIELIEDNEYYFDDNGIMIKNEEINNRYYKEDGKRVLGEINNKYYSEDGIEKDKFIEDKYYDLNGIYVENMIKDGNNIYYYENNEIVKGLKLINDIRYYFDFDKGNLIEKDVKSLIDISTWQGDINFDEVVNSKLVDGIIIRIGFGSLLGEDCTLDNKFERNISEIKRLNIPYGIYFYGYAQNEDATLVEANFTLDIINKYELDLSYGVFYDAELTEFNGIKYTKKLYKNVINKYISVLNENNINNVGVYGNLNMMEKGSLSILDKDIPRWIAQYNTKCEYDNNYVGWQYTSSGYIPGIEGKVDMNIFYK